MTAITASTDTERARFNMVEQQIRTWDVLDPQVLELLFELHREDFVPQQYRGLAFNDMQIPLGHGEKMLTPKLEARMLQSLALKPTDRVLEIGTGSGYMTALLARRAAHVHSVEIVPELSRGAAGALAVHGITNVTLETGDGARGWDAHAPYDAVVLTGSLPVLPEAWLNSLAPGGRLLAVIGDAPAMEARLYTCTAQGVCSTQGLFDTCIAPLRNALQPERFVF